MTTLELIEQRFGLDANKPLIEIPDTNRLTLAKLFAELEFKIGAEIGVERALYSKQLCESNPDAILYCIDPWLAYSGYREHVSQDKLDSFYQISGERLKGYKAHLVRKTSVEASKDFEDGSLDFVYIDGNHDFGHCAEDLYYWTPKVRKGGIVAGHDYIRRKNPEYKMHVVDVLHAYLNCYRIEPLFLLGRKDKLPGELRDDTRSWFFVKN